MRWVLRFADSCPRAGVSLDGSCSTQLDEMVELWALGRTLEGEHGY